MKTVEEQMTAPRPRWRSPIVRFFKWWAGLFVLLGPLAVCPFCAQPGCGGGALSAGVLGAIVAAITFVPRWIARLFKGRVQGEKQTL
ncbi:MAG: hypothetical protein KAV82_10770 [Phycisphaerae bacterium]|nr:hypothetical protein [Phycisphaerae bacterium]